MKLEFENIINKHKDETAVVALHGPGLTKYISKIEWLQENNKIKRISVNEWFDFFKYNPDYWIVANSVSTVKTYLHALNTYMVPFFYSDTVDKTKYSFVNATVKCDYLQYDQRHFQKKTCGEIISSVSDIEDRYNITKYGNNEIMFRPPRGLGGHYAVDDWCCKRTGRDTVQEVLQKHTKYNKHYSTGDTVAVHAIAFAILMGFKKIYIVGMNLDYSGGYANGSGAPNDDTWFVLKENLLNDLTILNESAKMIGTKIYNLNDTWYGIFEKRNFIK